MPGPLLLALQLSVVRLDGAYWVEAQAANGLRLWLHHFERIILLCPERVGGSTEGFVPLESLPFADRVEVVGLPLDYSVLGFARHLPKAFPRLRSAVARAGYIQVAPGYLAGDWAAIVGEIAHRAGRRYAVWTDRVEWHAIDHDARSRELPLKLYHRGMARLVRAFHHRVIRNAGLGLFHGMSTFRAYAALSADPHVVHDIHVPASFCLPPGQVAAKAARAGDPGRRLKITYVGRAHPDKGVDDWIDALGQVAAAGIDFEAEWHGGGPLLDHARKRSAAAGLDGRVRFAGPLAFEGIAAAMRAADLFLFCHKTLESPRNLIESIMSGTPLVGYHSDYAADLTEKGARLVPPNDVGALAAALVEMAADRPRLAAMTLAAAADGSHFSDEAVFRHRSELMLRLPAKAPT